MREIPFVLFPLFILLVFSGCLSVKPVNNTIGNSSDTEFSAASEFSSAAQSGTADETPSSMPSVTSSETPSNTMEENKANLYINGLLFNTTHILDNNEYFIPAEDISKCIGSQYQFDGDTKVATFSDGSTKISMAIGSDYAQVNTLNFECPRSFVEKNIVFMPIKFICEHFACQVVLSIYKEDYGADNSIYIYSSKALEFGDHLGGIKSNVKRINFGSSSNTAFPDDGIYQEIYYDVALPEFTGLKDKAFQKKLNSLFTSIYTDSLKEATSASKDALSSGYGYYHDQKYYIQSIRKGVLSSTVYDEIYCGGAHPGSLLTSYIIDFNSSKILNLNDLFVPSSDYKTRLLSEIEKVWNGGTGDYAGVTLPDSLDGNNFYLGNGTLVFYYNPYELACFARGSVYFEIPLKNVSDILADDYKDLA